LEGGTLATALGMHPDQSKKNSAGKRKFTFLQALNLARALACSMDYLHRQWHESVAVVHRDLKPDNIGFTANGILKVFDFGLCACIKTSAESDPKTDVYAMTGNTGTLRYMAPEVALGESYNQSVDVYSFGIIFWQVLKGKIPFEEMNKKMFFDKVVRGKFRPLLDSLWPKSLCDLLESCWHEDYQRRPTFGEVVVRLDELIDENKNYLSCFCLSLNIPVTFSNGICCIDPEFIAKNRHFFVFSHLVVYIIGVLSIILGFQTLGSLLVEFSVLSLYICLYMSWEYWPSGNGKGSKTLRWWSTCCSRSYEALDRDGMLNSSLGKIDSSSFASPSVNPIHHGISLNKRNSMSGINNGSKSSVAYQTSVTVEV
jgi:serine/threonine protein kinase